MPTPWSSIAGCFELKSWSMFSDWCFLPVEVKHMIVTDKATQYYNRVNNKLALGKGHCTETIMLRHVGVVICTKIITLYTQN